ncbi:MAG: protein phosphatase 2C domain-containing protein [Rhodocyclaceae bacterium]|nr:protein phosphatase 2C domain-containing protein [Rhodocyclaceae bacterium]
MKFSIFQGSRIGGRARNEDRIGYRYTAEALLMVLADGLGGHGHGEVAAEAAVRSIVATFEKQARPRLADPHAFLADALAGAHGAVLAQSALRGLDSPRTTCVVCVVQDGLACWAHAGDSRLYLLRNGRVLTRTHDHSRVQQLIDEGQLKPAGARDHPQRNLLTSCLGGEPAPRFAFSPKTPLKHGDVVLLCSDGLWGPLADDAPLARLSLQNPIKAAPLLLDRVESMAGAGRDNLSLVLMRWEDDRRPVAAPPCPGRAQDCDRIVPAPLARLCDKE